jgi:hypothetical protein
MIMTDKADSSLFQVVIGCMWITHVTLRLVLHTAMPFILWYHREDIGSIATLLLLIVMSATIGVMNMQLTSSLCKPRPPKKSSARRQDNHESHKTD